MSKRKQSRRNPVFFVVSFLCLTTLSTNANEYRFSLIDDSHNVRSEFEDNYTGIVLKRIQSHFRQFENNTDWRSRRDKTFSSSVWGFISNEIVAAETKMARYGISMHGKDPNKIMKYGNGFLTVDKYSGANWNALLMMNFINQALYGSTRDANSTLWAAVGLLQKEYGSNYRCYQKEIGAASYDIKMYVEQLKLYECLAEERRHIINVSLETGQQQGYLKYEMKRGKEHNTLANLKLYKRNQNTADKILHVTLPSNLKMAKGFNTRQKDLYDNAAWTIDFNDIDTSKITSMSEMFYQCKGLTSLNLSGFNTRKVKFMRKMFQECNNLISLDLFNFDTHKVRSMAHMFNECSSLHSLDLFNFNTSKVTHMYNMFYKNRSLTTLNLSSFDTRNVISMCSMFSGCENITSLNLSNFDTHKATDMWWMLSDCLNLTSLKFSGKFAAQKSYFILSRCNSLKSLIFDDISPERSLTVKSLVEAVPSDAKLENVSISYNGITSNNSEIEKLKKYINKNKDFNENFSIDNKTYKLNFFRKRS